jgi:protein involved in polysaccharide export with SLBB domain
VNVIILLWEVPPGKVFLAGEVHTPKALVLSPSVPMNVLAALLEVGGITEKGDPTHVTLLRTDADGKQRNQVIDTTKLSMGDSTEANPKLISGDVLMVPPADHYTFNGEFNKPGYVGMGDLHLESMEKPLLSRAIMGIGGIKKEADLSKLKILRLRKDGSREVLTPLADGTAVKDTTLQSGDIIDLPAKLTQKEPLPTQSAQSVTITGKVRSPGIYPVGESGLKLSRLILAAGGTTEFAKGSRVTINRPSEKGRLIVVNVDNIIKKGNWDQDVDLMEGDVVNVPERGY